MRTYCLWNSLTGYLWCYLLGDDLWITCALSSQSFLPGGDWWCLSGENHSQSYRSSQWREVSANSSTRKLTTYLQARAVCSNTQSFILNQSFQRSQICQAEVWWNMSKTMQQTWRIFHIIKTQSLWFEYKHQRAATTWNTIYIIRSVTLLYNVENVFDSFLLSNTISTIDGYTVQH